jgi:hypothetical protein
VLVAIDIGALYRWAVVQMGGWVSGWRCWRREFVCVESEWPHNLDARY